MSVRSAFPSHSASSYSYITAGVDITAAATGELEATCDLAAWIRLMDPQKPIEISGMSLLCHLGVFSENGLHFIYLH